jgi:hypothetical protein
MTLLFPSALVVPVVAAILSSSPLPRVPFAEDSETAPTVFVDPVEPTPLEAAPDEVPSAERLRTVDPSDVGGQVYFPFDALAARPPTGTRTDAAPDVRTRPASVPSVSRARREVPGPTLVDVDIDLPPGPAILLPNGRSSRHFADRGRPRR